MRTMRKIVKIEPYYEPRMWGGGSRLKEEFHYATDVAPLGEVYNVVALPGHADCFVPEMNCTLSQLYVSCPEWFECETKELPIRVNILDPMADLSIQIHPDDAFAKQYNGGRGKPEAWVILDAPTDGYIEFGHHAKTHEQFETWSTERKWDKLLRYLKTPVGGFIDIPDRMIEFQIFPSVLEHGCQVTRYRDEPGRYTLYRIETKEKGRFLHDAFAFYTCVKGKGTINGISVRQGEMDLFLASYRNERAD